MRPIQELQSEVHYRNEDLPAWVEAMHASELSFATLCTLGVVVTT
jgi:hypothetical protein